MSANLWITTLNEVFDATYVNATFFARAGGFSFTTPFNQILINLQWILTDRVVRFEVRLNSDAICTRYVMKSYGSTASYALAASLCQNPTLHTLHCVITLESTKAWWKNTFKPLFNDFPCTVGNCLLSTVQLMTILIHVLYTFIFLCLLSRLFINFSNKP